MSFMDFSTVEKEIVNAPAPHIKDKGWEGEIRIIKVNEGVGKDNNARWFMPYFDIPSDPMAKEFNTFFWNPLDNDKLDEKQRQKNNYNFNQLVQCFHLDLKHFSFDDLPGKKGWAILGIQKDEEFGDKNFISKYVVSGDSTPKTDNY